MDDLDPCLERIVDAARRPVSVDPAARQRLHSALAGARDSPGRRALRWLMRPSLRLSPMAAASLALLLVSVALHLGPSMREPAREFEPAAGQFSSDARRVQFVLVAPAATHVSVVGDFNGWNPTATPLRPTGHGGVWTADVVLEAGRYTYSFLVNGAEWHPDPAAPNAPGDDFGRPSSVILVHGGTT